MKGSTDRGSELNAKNKDDNDPSHNKRYLIIFIEFISKLFSFTLSEKKKSDSNDSDIYPLY